MRPRGAVRGPIMRRGTSAMLVTALGVLGLLAASPSSGQAPTPTATSPTGAVEPARLTATVPAPPDQPNPTIELQPAGASPTPTPEPGPPPVPATAEEPTPTVSGPLSASQRSASRLPAAGKPVSARPGGPLSVKSWTKGKKITLLRPTGLEVTYRLAADADLPPDMVPGSLVTLETKLRKNQRVVTKVSPASVRPANAK